MKFMQGVVVIFCVVLIRGLSSISYKDSADLVSQLLSDYDPRQRPVADQTHPVYVSMYFFLLTIQDFDEVSEKFSAYGLLWMTWTDQILTWDPAEHGGAFTAIFKLSDVWYPKLVLTKPHSKLEDLGDDWMIIRINSSGFTSFAPGSVFEATCSVDITYYPFDTQNCSLSFSVWGYFGYEVILNTLDDVVNTDHFTENGEWDLVSTSVNRIGGGLYTSDAIHFNFILKRKATFLVVNVILPIIFMAVINLLVFVLPAESGERVSYSVTVLLALAVFMTLVGDNLPKKSEPMSVLSYYLMSLLVLSTLMTVTTILNLKLFFKKGQVPICLKSLIRLLRCFPCRFRQTMSIPRNKIAPIKGNNIKFVMPVSAVESTNSDSVSQNKREVTWQDVSFLVDKVAIVTFFVSTVVVNIVFLVILSQNKDMDV